MPLEAIREAFKQARWTAGIAGITAKGWPARGGAAVEEGVVNNL
jgi:hypothetical protein